MAKLVSVKPQENFIVAMNGDYNLPFDEVKTLEAVEGNTYVEALAGITSKAAEANEWVRVMVRGNPTTVDAQAIDLGLTPEDAIAALEAVGIIVVNK